MEISLMFSGGIDSTYTAIQLAKEYDKIHLLTYSNGYGHYKTKRSENRFKELNKLFPKKFTYNYFPIKKIFENVLINHIDQDAKKYSSGFIWCFGCKLSMHTRTILFNKQNKLKLTADGSSQDTSEMVEQSPFSISLIQQLYKDQEMEFITPTYQVTRKEKRRKLKKMGFKLGIQILDRHIGIQPKCIPGELYYSPLIIMGRPPHHQIKEIYKFYKSKLPIIKEQIQNGML